MAHPVESFIRKNGATAAIFNIVLNPLIAWFSNTDMADVPLTGGGSAAMDTAITCILMSLLVSLFVSADTRRALKAGTLKRDELPRGVGRLLYRLPSVPWMLGIFLGAASAVVVTPFLVGLFTAFGVVSLPFSGFALLKAAYTPMLAYAVARWVILRQLAAAVT